MKAIVAAFPVAETADRRISPYHLLRADMPPLFLTWGTKDVFAESLDKLVSRARELSLAPVVHVEPDARHGFILFARYQTDALARIDAFLVGAGLLSATADRPEPGADYPARQAALWARYSAAKSD